MVARAVKLLRRYYRDLPVRSDPKPCLPCPTFSQNEPSHALVFKKRLFFEGKADNRRPIFRAELNNLPVLVKFCETHGEAAHRTLAAEGLAPTLHHCFQLTGGAIMVIMDQICSQDADQEFEDSDLPFTVNRDIQHALGVLHHAGLVFGDLRRPNIMVTKSQDRYDDDEWHGQLVDFDWSGTVGEAKYRAMLNEKIRWAHGVEGGAVILPQHVRDILKKARDW